MSGDFRSRLSDLIRLLHNSKMDFSQVLLDGTCQPRSVWEFIGVFSGSELGYGGIKWSFRLNKAQIEAVLTREAEFKANSMGDWD